MGKKMTREEELKGLKAMYESIAAIPEEKRFDYFFNNSPTFRKDITTNINYAKASESIEDIINSDEIALYKNYLALVALRNLASMVYPNYLKRAEYSARDMSYPLDVVIQG